MLGHSQLKSVYLNKLVWYCGVNSGLFWRSICVQEIKKIQQTTTENIQIYCAMYFVFLTAPTKRDSINLQRTVIFIYTQKINFLPSFLHEILHFKNRAIWLAESSLTHKLRARIWPLYCLCRDNNSNMIFHFRWFYFQENLIKQFFRKCKKYHFWTIFGPFCPKLNQW